MAEHDIADLVKLVEFEINHLRTQEKRPGWNTWGLLGTLAATVWFALAEVEEHPVSINNVLFAFLVFSLSFDSIRWILNFLIQSDARRGPLRFYITKIHFSNSRLPVFVNILFFLALCLIVFVNPLLAHASIKYWALAYCLFTLLVLMAVLVLTLLEFPILTEQQPVLTVICLLILVLFSASITVKLNLIFWSLPPTLPEVRVGLSTVVSAICITLLSTSTPRSPLLSTLTDVRRKLGLNLISYSDAKQQIETALEGLQISDVLQKEVNIILTNVREAVGIGKSIIEELRSLCSTIPDFNNLSPEQRTLRDSVVRSALSRLQTPHGLKEIDQALKQLLRKTLLIRTTKRGRAEADRFLDRLKAQFHQIKQISDIEQKEINELMDKLKADEVSDGTQKPALLANNR